MTDQTVGAIVNPERRVLQVTATSWVVGNQVLPIASRLLADGWEVDVACPFGPGIELLATMAIRHQPVRFSRSVFSLQHLASVWMLYRMIRRRDYSVVHLHGPFPGILGRVAAWVAHTPAIYHCRGTFYEGESGSLFEKLKVWMYSRAERLVAPHTDWAFTLNMADAEDLTRKAGIASDKVTCTGVGGCGLDMAVWDSNRYDRFRKERIREELGIPFGQAVIGFVGRIVREKGVIELFEAFCQVREAGWDVHLLLVGGVLPSERDQRTRRDVKKRVLELGLSDRVTMTGDSTRAADMMAVMDLLALPSYREGFGQVIVEAGSLGVPVVAAASRGARSAIIDGETGLLVPLRDAAALAVAIIGLLQEPDRAATLGRTASERAHRELNREAFLDRVISVYDRLFGRYS